MSLRLLTLRRRTEIKEQAGPTGLYLATALAHKAHETIKRFPASTPAVLSCAFGVAVWTLPRGPPLIRCRATRRHRRRTLPPPRREVVSGVDALTPSERRVAGLAAEGITNSEIAQSLFVTIKTVEFHLANTYRKLDIDGRTSLADALGHEPRPAS